MSEAPENRLADLAASLYTDVPKRNMHHYTSLEGIVGIHETQGLWATKIQYFSDSSELNHAFALFRRQVEHLFVNNLGPKDLLSNLNSWIQAPHHTANAAVFVVCFTERYDSLSQWRSYTPVGRGVCLELQASHLLACTRAHGYDIAKCIYQGDKKWSLAKQAVDFFVSEATKIGPDASGDYFHAFAALQQDLLRIAATFKHEAFEDEREWRAVLRHDGSSTAPKIAYRAGRNTVIPYVSFPLVHPDTEQFRLWNICVGPTPHMELSVAALKSLFANQINCGRYPVMPSKAPYRET